MYVNYLFDLKQAQRRKKNGLVLKEKNEDDPGDHFDIAALYALGELDIHGIVLDQEKSRGE